MPSGWRGTGSPRAEVAETEFYVRARVSRWGAGPARLKDKHQESTMKKLICTNWITLDGYIAGPTGEMDWILGDDQLSDYELGMVDNADTLLFGKKTYQDFAQYWPAVPGRADAMPWEHEFARRVNPLRKVVVSRTLQQAGWGESTLWRELDPAVVEQLKQGPGKSILMYGSATVVQQLTNLGLIDEYHLLVHPLLLGRGRLLLDNLDGRVRLERVEVKPFASGVVQMVYRPAK